MKVLLPFLVVLLAACTSASEYEVYCANKAQCLGGNDKDRNACEAEESAAQRAASAYGCDDLWIRYERCVGERFAATCIDGVWDASLACPREEKALIDCKRVASGLKPKPNPPEITTPPTVPLDAGRR